MGQLAGLAAAHEAGNRDFPHAQQGQGKDEHDGGYRRGEAHAGELLPPLQAHHHGGQGQRPEHAKQPQRVVHIEQERPGAAFAGLLDERHDLQAQHGQHAGHHVEHQPAQKGQGQIKQQPARGGILAHRLQLVQVRAGEFGQRLGRVGAQVLEQAEHFVFPWAGIVSGAGIRRRRLIALGSQLHLYRRPVAPPGRKAITLRRQAGLLVADHGPHAAGHFQLPSVDARGKPQRSTPGDLLEMFFHLQSAEVGVGFHLRRFVRAELTGQLHALGRLKAEGSANRSPLGLRNRVDPPARLQFHLHVQHHHALSGAWAQPGLHLKRLLAAEPLAQRASNR